MQTDNDVPPDVAETDARLRAALSSARPPAGLEDGVVQRLRAGRRPLRLSPPARRAAVVAAATAAVVTVGFLGTRHLPALFGPGSRPRPATNGSAVAATRPGAAEYAAIKKQQQQYAAAKLVEKAKREQAVDRTQDALHDFTAAAELDPENQAAAAGRDEEAAALGIAPTGVGSSQGNIGERVSPIRYKFESEVNRANENIAARKFDDAQRNLDNALVARNTDPTRFTPSQLNDFDTTIQNSRVALETARAASESVDTHQASASTLNTERDRQTDYEQNRQKTVETLIQSARNYQDQGQYKDALSVVDQLQRVDPTNQYALGVRQLILDKANGQEQRQFTERYNRNLERPYNSGGEANVPPNAFRPESFGPQSELQVALRQRNGLGTITDGDQSKALAEAVQQVQATAMTANQNAAQVSANQVADAARNVNAVAPEGAPAATRPAVDGRKVIRTGTMAFDVDRFDAAADTVAKVAGEAGGFVATTDSQKLPNGKTAGTITVRVPPERLDLLVLSLRSLGELKTQQITAQDVTKEYTDLEAELVADRAMQDRLLDLIRTGKGSIKDLLAAETELGTWRVKIEKIEGQLRYYAAQVGLSTLAVSISERDIQQAAAAVVTETADVGVETDDVERARDAATKAIDDGRGRIVEAELKRLDAGQLAARIVADVPPEAAGGTIDRLKQLGRVARLEVRRQQSQSNEATAAVRTERRPTRITLSIYNLANVAPRRTTAVTLAASDPEAAYAAVLAVADPGGRVVTSNLDRSANGTGTVAAEVPPARLEAALAVVRSAGEVLKRTATVNPDTQNTTDAKVGLTVTIVPLAGIAPRETVAQTVAAADVPAAYRAVTAAAGRGHVRIATLDEQDRQNVSATVEVDVPRASLAEFDKAVMAAGDTVARSASRSADADNTVDSAVRVRLSLVSADRLAARETTTLTVEVADADRAATDAQAAAVSAGGRVLTADVNRSPAGPATAKVVVDVPLARAADVVGQLRQLGTVRGVDAARDAAAPAGPLAHARIEVDLATADALVADRSGPAASVRHGLSVGLAGLLWSLQYIVVGLCLLGPWVAIAFVGRWVWRRRAARA